MTQDTVIDILQMVVRTVVAMAAPPLLMGLSVGILVSIFQAVTSIQEPTLAFVPKILAVFAAMLIFGPYMMTIMQEMMLELYGNLQFYVTPR